MVFHRIQRGLYDVHTMILPRGRGSWALGFVRACLHRMFCETEAVELMTRCPKGNLASKALTRAIGGTLEFTNPHGWVFGHRQIPADIYSLDVKDWMRTAPGLSERGKWFHDMLHAEYEKHGRTEPSHPDDETHDRYVGMACEMMLGGQPEKATILYNRYAALADYQSVTIQNRSPLIVNIRDALLLMRDGGFEVLKLAEA